MIRSIRDEGSNRPTTSKPSVLYKYVEMEHRAVPFYNATNATSTRPTLKTYPGIAGLTHKRTTTYHFFFLITQYNSDTHNARTLTPMKVDNIDVATCRCYVSPASKFVCASLVQMVMQGFDTKV